MSLPENIIEWNDSVEAFLAAVKEFKGLVVLDFYSPYCGPCKRILSILPQIATQNADVRFYKCNVDDAEDFSCAYKISSIPHFKFFKNNEAGEPTELEAILSPSIEQIKEAIAKYK